MACHSSRIDSLGNEREPLVMDTTRLFAPRHLASVAANATLAPSESAYLNEAHPLH
jgi:hypothetical protein